MFLAHLIVWTFVSACLPAYLSLTLTLTLTLIPILTRQTALFSHKADVVCALGAGDSQQLLGLPDWGFKALRLRDDKKARFALALGRLGVEARLLAPAHDAHTVGDDNPRLRVLRDVVALLRAESIDSVMVQVVFGLAKLSRQNISFFSPPSPSPSPSPSLYSLFSLLLKRSL